MNPAARTAGTRAASRRERLVRRACPACGHVFTLHYSLRATDPSDPRGSSRVPCLNEGCGGEVEIVLPARAFAVWTEEY